MMLAIAGIAMLRPPPAFGARLAHRIYIKDVEGKPITAKTKKPGPYSTKKTCGECHDYKIIGCGSHEMMWPDEPLPAPATYPGRNWIITHKVSGMQAHPSMGFIAPKKNPAGVGLSYWEFARDFGGRHVGGGPMEFDRDGKQYAERIGSEEEIPEDDGDYKNAKWFLSGVQEVDCLMCHGGESYEPVFRAMQIEDSENFMWAPTVATGLGTVRYSVKNISIGGDDEGAEEEEGPPLPQVKYNPQIFNADGTVSIDIRTPDSKRCLFCHETVRREPLKRIDETTDIHWTSGMTCVDCHRTGLEHRPSPGYEAHGYEGPPSKTLTCRGCHTTGRGGAPVALHRGLPEHHLEKITCVACHSGPKPEGGLEVKSIETVATPLWPEMKDKKREQYRGPVWQMPIFKQDEFGRIRVYQRLLPNYWAVVGEDKALRGLLPREIDAPIKEIAESINDDDGDGRPEVNTQAEIKATIEAIGKSLKGQKVVYLRGGLRYELADPQAGKPAPRSPGLSVSPAKAGEPMDWPIAHDVRPAAQALGAKDCTECHSIDSPFFFAEVKLDALSPEGKPITKPMAEFEGQDTLFQKLFALSFMFRPIFKPTCLASAAIMAGVLGFYFMAGLTGYRRKDGC